MVGFLYSVLEGESQHKSQEPHGCVVLDVGDAPGIPTAIDTSIALGVVEAQDRVVEDVVGIHAELRPVALGDAEVFRKGKIRRE